MADSGLGDDLFQNFLNYLFTSEGISVPADFHLRCGLIEELKGNDITGVVNSVTDYQVSSASNTQYMIECNDVNLQEILNTWLSQINENIKGVPTGLQELSKEYFKERWQGSSFCILRGKGWKPIKVGDLTIEVPTTLYYVNGASVYVKRPLGSYNLGSDEFFLDKGMKDEPVPKEKSEIVVVSKPFNRWQDQYPSPYLVRKGIVKNYLGMKALQEKSDEVITKILPYLFIVKKGSEALRRAGINYKDGDFKEIADGLKGELEKFKAMKKKTPVNVTGDDTDYSHLIPDLRNVVSEELYRQGYRATLAGLGIIELIPVTGDSRQQSQLNPKALIEETNSGVEGFKDMIMDVISRIKEKNKIDHKKLFSEKKKLMIYNSPLKINTEQIMDAVRSGFDRGQLSSETYIGTLGFNIDIEREKRIKEYENGDEDILYPHLVNNQEGKDERFGTPASPRKTEKIVNENKKKGTPESKNYKNANEEKLIAKCKKCGHEFEYLSVQEAGMGYVKCPKCEEAVTQEDLIIAPYKNVEELPKYIKKMTKHCQEVFMSTFNSVYKDTGDEGKSFAIANSAARRCMKKQGYNYDKETKTWKKK
jgi:cation transport regulator ChaB/predicted Zn-ribbon and HTH transcriptional regulator